jgi:outer membrane protein OmpA-like peptidoglycan-associated protein
MTERLCLTAILVAALGMASGSARAQEPAEQETDVPGVTARLLHATRQDGVLTVAILLRNAGSTAAASSAALEFSRFVVMVPQSRSKRFPLKDADGRYLAGPISDWNGGGRWFVAVPAGSSRVVWAMFEPEEPGTRISIEAPLLPPFDDVEVAAAGPATSGEPRAASGELSALVTSASRTEGQLRLRVRVSRGASGEVPTRALEYAEVWLFDPGTRRKYGLLKDTDGQWLAQPKSDSNGGGRYFLNSIAPKGQVFLNLTFTPPPDTVRRVQLLLPYLPPTGLVDIAGTTGAAETGAAVAGRTVGIEAAVKALDARVSPAEISVDLAADVLFDLDKADLKPAAETTLNHLLAVVNSRPSARVAIEGHTDVRGEAAYNQALSERRAAAVRAWLVGHGVDAARISATGAGESRPIRTGTTEADHRANRRVEIRIRG